MSVLSMIPMPPRASVVLSSAPRALVGGADLVICLEMRFCCHVTATGGCLELAPLGCYFPGHTQNPETRA